MHFDNVEEFVDYRMHRHNRERQTPYSAVK